VARPLQWVRSFNHRNKETIMKTKTASFALTAAALFAALAHAEGSAGFAHREFLFKQED
jgi:hypothetical protein